MRPTESVQHELPESVVLFPGDKKVVYEARNVRSRKLKIDIDSDDGTGTQISQSFYLFLRMTKTIAYTRFAIVGQHIPHAINVYNIDGLMLAFKNTYELPIVVTVRALG